MLLQFQNLLLQSTCKFMLGHWFLLYAIIFFIHLSYRIIHYHFMIFIANTIWNLEGFTNQHNLNLILATNQLSRWTWKLYSFAYWSWKRSHRLVTACIGNLRAENQLSFSYGINWASFDRCSKLLFQEINKTCASLKFIKNPQFVSIIYRFFLLMH